VTNDFSTASQEIMNTLLRVYGKCAPLAGGSLALPELLRGTLHSSNDNPLYFHAENDVHSHTMMVTKAAYENHTDNMALIGAALFHDSGKWWYKREDGNGRRSFKGHHLGGAAVAREALLTQEVIDELFGGVDIAWADWYADVQVAIQHHQLRDIPKQWLEALASRCITTMSYEGQYYVQLVDTLAALDRRGSFNTKRKPNPHAVYVRPNRMLAPTSEIPYTLTARTNQEFLIGDVMSINPELVVMQGVPGSGKSHMAHLLAERLGNARVVSYDDIRMEMYTEYSGDDNPSYSQAFQYAVDNKNKLASRFSEQVRAGLNDGATVIIDNTNISTKSRRRSLAPVHGRNLRTAFVVMETHPSVALGRNAERVGKNVPEDLIISQHMRTSWPFEYIGRNSGMFVLLTPKPLKQ